MSHVWLRELLIWQYWNWQTELSYSTSRSSVSRQSTVRFMWHQGNIDTRVQCLSSQNGTNNAVRYRPLGKKHWSCCKYRCCGLFMMRHSWIGKHLSLCAGAHNWAHAITEWNSSPNGERNPVLHDILKYCRNKSSSDLFPICVMLFLWKCN